MGLRVRRSARQGETRGAEAAGRRQSRSVALALVDQVLSSGTGLLLIVLVARGSTPATFGALSLALVVNGLLLGAFRAAVGEVVMLRTRARDHDARADTALGLGLAVVAGIAVLLAVGLGGLALGGASGRFLVIVAVAAPFIYGQDLLRYVAYGGGHLERAVGLDAIWLTAQLAGSFLLLDDPTAVQLALAWLAGAVLSAASGAAMTRIRPALHGFAAWWRRERARAASFVGDYLISTGMVQSSFILIGILLTLEEFGALRAAFVAFSPLANLLAGVRTLILARLGGLRDEPLRARTQALRLAIALAAAGACYGAVIVTLPADVGRELFGETWTSASALVAFVAVGEVFRLSTFPAIDLTKVAGTPVELVRNRATAGAGVVLGLVSGALVAGPRGAAIAGAGAYLVATTVWWRQAWRLAERGASSRP